MLNQALVYDGSAKYKLKKLQNKTLAVELTDLSLFVTLKVFDQKVFVSSQLEDAECTIKTTINGLQKLSDAAQITALIKNDELELDGDLHVAQSFSSLFMDNDIDWQEWLSEYLGDAAAHKLSRLVNKQHIYLNRKKRDLEYTLHSALIDELRLTPDQSEVTVFSQQVDRLNAQSERLSAEINKLKALLWNSTDILDSFKSFTPFYIIDYTT